MKRLKSKCERCSWYVHASLTYSTTPYTTPERLRSNSFCRLFLTEDEVEEGAHVLTKLLWREEEYRSENVEHNVILHSELASL